MPSYTRSIRLLFATGTGLGAGFHAPLPFELNVGLTDSGDTHPDTLAHAPQGGQAIARSQRACINIFCYQINHLAIQVIVCILIDGQHKLLRSHFLKTGAVIYPNAV
jgi:hypothetical protein